MEGPPPLVRDVPVLNAAVVWGHPRRVDHDPVVADLASSFPLQEDSAEGQERRWKQILELVGHPGTQQKVAALVEGKRGAVQAAREQLLGVLDACGRAGTGANPTFGQNDQPEALGGLLPWLPVSDSRTPELNNQVSQAHACIMDSVLAAVKSLECPAPSSRRHGRASSAWDEFLTQLRELCQTMRFALNHRLWRPPSEDLLARVRSAWDKGVAQT